MIGHGIEENKLSLLYGQFFYRLARVRGLNVDVERPLISIHNFKIGMVVHSHSEIIIENFEIKGNRFQSKIFYFIEGAIIHVFDLCFSKIAGKKRWEENVFPSYPKIRDIVTGRNGKVNISLSFFYRKGQKK